ncbi:RNF220 domain-containing protein [Mycena sanguinolenta]|uniref:RNF220 domain-containing protein n=1 Tax=Mycena sanguinolenta TaxID=230812 RepID=A0A8H6YMN9_9AGAR|nr:RNF220 domain-containing protein [Mycena sanguinolenta]
MMLCISFFNPESRRATVEEIEDDGDCRDSSRHNEADDVPSHTANSQNISGTYPADIDPSLIEIIGRFEIIDDYDDLGALEMEDDCEDDREDETEIQELSELENFTAVLKRAQEIAVAREREKEKGRKRARHYTGNSRRTQERRAKINRDMRAKGFLSVGAFLTHVRQKVSKNKNMPETAISESHEEQSMGEETPGGLVDEDVQVDDDESEGEELEDNIHPVANDLHGHTTSENIPADPVVNQLTAAQQKVAEMLQDLCADKTPKDDSLATASDLALDQLHYKDFPALRRARALLEIKSKDKKLDVFFRGRITAMLGTLNLYLDPELSYTWRQASLVVSRSQGHGINHARNIRTWLHAFLSKGVLPMHRLGAFRATVLDDEDFSLPIQMHLQSIAKQAEGYIRAQDIVDFIANTPEMQDLMEKSGSKRKSISLRTAQRWLHKMGWRFGKKKNGMYVDGHERPDVVEYREGFIARWKEYDKRMNVYDNDGNLERGPERNAPPGSGPFLADGRAFKLILVTHDESTFSRMIAKRIAGLTRRTNQLHNGKGRGNQSWYPSF